MVISLFGKWGTRKLAQFKWRTSKYEWDFQDCTKLKLLCLFKYIYLKNRIASSISGQNYSNDKSKYWGNLVTEGQTEACPVYFISLADSLVIRKPGSKYITVMALTNLSHRHYQEDNNNDKPELLLKENEE